MKKRHEKRHDPEAMPFSESYRIVLSTSDRRSGLFLYRKIFFTIIDRSFSTLF